MAGTAVTQGLVADFRLRRADGFGLDICFTAPPGSTLALLGPNGAGKTTTVAALSGLLAIDEGHVALDGTVLDDPARGVFVPPESRDVGVVFQDRLLFPHMTIDENVSFGLRSRGKSRSEARAEARVWLEKTGLSGVGDRRPTDLSGGQAQLAALARALSIGPRLLLLDEPLSALDVTVRSRTRRILVEHLEAFSGPRILITHDPMEAFLLADEICVIEAGSVTQTGTPDDIRLRPRTPYAADLAGANLLRGVATPDGVEVAGLLLHVVSGASGETLLTIDPRAVVVHLERPSGSARNVWATVVDSLERLGDRVRLRTGMPVPLTAEITSASADELGIRPGVEIWVSVKATEIRVQSE